ncbi:hypothetical protein M413DRAFT_111895 [Hebeloma cylindrosporum]|uniref:Uncharacterized protein n=1 Tax=Hebeloma cylindrosporum TaxID=76867 RepID=A0A0C2Z8Y3_HEBCY|nr:hypothetical protein M413DRAFT_111895 [Hebeloma cylindrosporum h7]
MRKRTRPCVRTHRKGGADIYFRQALFLSSANHVCRYPNCYTQSGSTPKNSISRTDDAKRGQISSCVSDIGFAPPETQRLLPALAAPSSRSTNSVGLLNVSNIPLFDICSAARPLAALSFPDNNNLRSSMMLTLRIAYTCLSKTIFSSMAIIFPTTTDSFIWASAY